MKVMSIIGIIWFSLCFLFIIIALSGAEKESNALAAAGWGILGMLYAIPYSIVGLIQSNKASRRIDSSDELIRLADLRAKGLLTEDEFQAKKIDLLSRK